LLNVTAIVRVTVDGKTNWADCLAMPDVATTTPHRLVWSGIDSQEIISPAKTVPLLRAAVAAAADRTDLKRQLARSLFKIDRMTEIVDWLRPILDRDDSDAELLNYLGRAAFARGDYLTALNALRMAAASGYNGSLGWVAQALARLQRTDEAIGIALQALKDPTPDFRPLSLLARLLPPRGEAERLWEMCVELRARGYWGGYLPAASAFAAAATRRKEEVAVLLNPARWFSAGRLDTRKDFNASLSAELLANKNLSAAHSLQATRGDSVWIEDLHIFGGPLAKELFAEFRLAVADYVAQRELFADDPMIVHRLGRVRLNGWATLVHCDGHQNWHIHPDGWISGVYYVDLPNRLSADRGSEGDIEFGLYPFENKMMDFDSYCWRIKPEAGRLLLFPSYYAHRTWPTKVSDWRLSIAFDVVPVEPANAG
jgi:tetratricopeptide (TPR) repeat protein